MFSDIRRIRDSIEGAFARKKVLVVGDIMLDRYLWGSVSRISPEAPVPVVKLLRQTETAGGAGNVALNAAGLDLKVAVCGFAGADSDGDKLVKLLESAGVSARGIVRMDRPTITKTRVIGGHQQMLRVDMEDSNSLDGAEMQRLTDAVGREIGDGVSVVIMSDYAKGTLSADLCAHAIRAAREAGIPVLVDPKGMDYAKYSGATAVSPNRAELAEVSRVPIGDLDGLMSAGQRLCRELKLNFLLVTLSELGMALIQPDSMKRIPAVGREVFDVSGAGDTVIATLAAGIAAGLDPEDAVSLANLAAGIVVEKVGTTPIRIRELMHAISTEEAIEHSDKICSPEDLLARIAGWRARGEKIAFTNGCFDLLHVGHVTYLDRAKKEGDWLIVGLNTDRSVRALKGEGRPVIPQDERARVLASLAAVDAVILFDEDTPLKLIKAIHPDVLVKGNDYTEDQVVGGREVKSWGGRVVLVPLVQGRSTSRILKDAAKADRKRSDDAG